MADVAGVQHEFWSCRQRVDLVHRDSQSCSNVRICGLVESHVAVADLHEAQFTHCVLGTQLWHPAQGVRFQYASLNYAKRASTNPSHALQKAATIDSVVVMVKDDFVVLLSWHQLLLVLFLGDLPNPLSDAYFRKLSGAERRKGEPRRPWPCFLRVDKCALRLIPKLHRLLTLFLFQAKM